MNNPLDFTVTCSQSLSKTYTVSTDSYDREYDDWEKTTFINTSYTDWSKEFTADGHRTPKDLIKILCALLKTNLEAGRPLYFNTQRTEQIIKECEGWIEDDTAFIEE